MNGEKTEPIVTIGIPAYNGEKTITRTIDSILSQTILNFKLVISDDGSTDSTPKICREYEQRDSRIKYIQQNKNKGWIKNWTFLAENSDTKYFVWISDDDYWEPQFLEKNIEVLETNPKIVGSISNVQLVGPNIKNYYPNQKEINSTESNFKFILVRSINGSYKEKIKNVLEFNWVINLYSIFRTDELKKSIIHERFVSWDFALILNIIKFGELHVIDEVLAYRDTEGITSIKSSIDSIKTQRLGWFKTYFPYISYTIWCMRNIGIRNFIRHISCFKYLIFHSEKKIIREILKLK
jgi:glycosyltransferase involved in cell wall biosynthesis